ncbi:hypothetical protein DY000_02052664 [Brassica cretica]|uniref:Uncharacterized protein n=1 Tax=Brassica cretica TaxID=69181 RepID=A0ABQ7AAN8_BRACR|nr:hypothetical protein DY000_02052664 [Brassica cretica]
MEGSPYRKFSISRKKGGDPGTGPGKLNSGEPGFLLAGILGNGVPSSGDPEAGVLPGEIMNNNLLALDELLRLRAKEVELRSEFDVTAVSDFSVGRLDLPLISEDLPEEFFAKVPSEMNESGDVAKRAGDQFEDGEFDGEE